MELLNLKEIGLTDGEIKVYNALLEHGDLTSTKLAKAAKVSTSKVYEITDRLIDKGIISSVKKEGILHFSAADPERLLDFIRTKEKEIQKEKSIVESLMPALLNQYKRTREETEVNVFYGWSGLKTAFLSLENSLGKGDESLVFGASIGKSPKQADIFFRQHQQRVEERGYKVRIIFNEDMRARKQRHEYYDQSPLHEIRYLHQTTFTELYVYKDYVLILMLLKNPIGIRVRGREVVESFGQFFETMWRQARP
jgi:predicted DNA-binding transcriptional regulator